MDRIVVLCDKETNFPYMHKDFGFSVYIKYKGYEILFDTGSKPGILEWNSEVCEVNLKNIDYVFISHNHWDHIGGSIYFIDKNIKTNLVICENTDIYRDLKRKSIVYSSYFLKTLPSFEEAKKTFNVYYSSKEEDKKKIERDIPFLNILGPYNIPFNYPTKEQAILLNTHLGLILLVGCSHFGIENLVKKVVELYKKDIYYLLGGFHLYQTPIKEVEKIANTLKEYVEFISPTHCTGEEAEKVFEKIFKDRFIKSKVGLEIAL